MKSQESSNVSLKLEDAQTTEYHRTQTTSPALTVQADKTKSTQNKSARNKNPTRSASKTTLLDKQKRRMTMMMPSNFTVDSLMNESQPDGNQPININITPS